jgi:hypothetical protein
VNCFYCSPAFKLLYNQSSRHDHCSSHSPLTLRIASPFTITIRFNKRPNYRNTQTDYRSTRTICRSTLQTSAKSFAHHHGTCSRPPCTHCYEFRHPLLRRRHCLDSHTDQLFRGHEFTVLAQLRRLWALVLRRTCYGNPVLALVGWVFEVDDRAARTEGAKTGGR